MYTRNAALAVTCLWKYIWYTKYDGMCFNLIIFTLTELLKGWGLRVALRSNQKLLVVLSIMDFDSSA